MTVDCSQSGAIVLTSSVDAWCAKEMVLAYSATRNPHDPDDERRMR